MVSATPEIRYTMKIGNRGNQFHDRKFRPICAAAPLPCANTMSVRFMLPETIKTTKMVAEESVKAAKEGSVTAVAVAGAVAGAGVGLVMAAPGMPKEVKVAPPAGGEPEQWEAL